MSIVRIPGVENLRRRATAVSVRGGAVWTVVRVIGTVFFVFDALLTFGQFRMGQFDASQTTLQWVIEATIIVLLWSPRTGLLMLAAALPWALVVNPFDEDTSLLAVAPVVLIPWLKRRWHVAVLMGLLAIFVPLEAVCIPSATLMAGIVTRYMSLTASCVVGLAARWFLAQHKRGLERIESLEQANRRIRLDERTALARELHDVVAHQLSITSLQIMGHRNSSDIDELRGAMDRIDDATRAALGELRLLVGVLRETDMTAPTTDLSHLREQTQPSAVAQSLATTLTEHGFVTDMRVPPEIDTLDLSEQRTLSRVLQEATTNILRNAPDGARCCYLVETSPDQLHVRISNPMPAPGSPKRLAGQSMGYGLRGIRERVDLTGGTLRAEQVGPDWVLEMELPRASAR